MQKEMKIGDELLAEDVKYVLPEGSQVIFAGPVTMPSGISGAIYLAFPSAHTPRFLVPEKDKYALRFVLNIMSAHRGILGAILRTTINIPGMLFLVKRIVFRECIIVKT